MGYGADFWQGLLEWLRDTLLPHGTISASDFEFITVTDDIDEIVSIMAEHRHWKEDKIRTAEDSLTPVV